MPEYDTSVAQVSGSVVARQTIAEITREIVGRTKRDNDGQTHRFDSVYKTVMDVSREHQPRFCSMANALSIKDMESAARSFGTVVQHVFADGQFNYGRLVSVWAFAGFLCEYCLKESVIVEEDVDLMGILMGQHISDQVASKSTWDELKEFCVQSGHRFSWKSALCKFVGLGAHAILIGVQ